jgi:hypothetical protein
LSGSAHRRSSGPSLTGGCVVRSAQPVLRPPPTPTRPAPTSRCAPVIGHHASGSSTPQPAGPGRASPVPAVTIRTFRTPYAGEFLAAAFQGLHRFRGLHRGSRGSALPCPTTRRVCQRRGRFRVMLRTVRLLPPTGHLTLGFDAGRFPPTPPACYRASWQLPGPDFHRQATASLRLMINPYIRSTSSLLGAQNSTYSRRSQIVSTVRGVAGGVSPPGPRRTVREP